VPGILSSIFLPSVPRAAGGRGSRGEGWSDGRAEHLRPDAQPPGESGTPPDGWVSQRSTGSRLRRRPPQPGPRRPGAD